MEGVLAFFGLAIMGEQYPCSLGLHSLVEGVLVSLRLFSGLAFMGGGCSWGCSQVCVHGWTMSLPSLGCSVRLHSRVEGVLAFIALFSGLVFLRVSLLSLGLHSWVDNFFLPFSGLSFMGGRCPCFCWVVLMACTHEWRVITFFGLLSGPVFMG